VRFQTTIDSSFEIIFLTRFSPIVPRPINQRWGIGKELKLFCNFFESERVFEDDITLLSKNSRDQFIAIFESFFEFLFSDNSILYLSSKEMLGEEQSKIFFINFSDD